MRVGPDHLHPPQHVLRVPAQLAEFGGDLAGLDDQDLAQRAQGRIARRLVQDPLAQRGQPVGVRPEQGGFLGGEVIEEGTRRDVRRLGDVLHRDVHEAAPGHEVQRVPAQRPAGGELLALAQ